MGPPGRILLLLVLAGCRPDISSSPAEPLEKPPIQTWKLSGRAGTASMPGTSGAAPLPGASLLLERCQGRQPCFAERWRAEDGAQLDLVRAGEHLLRPKGAPWPGRWRRLNGVLAECLGDPLSIPPGDDPLGLRWLQQDGERWTWQLRLSGANRCGLEGALILAADGPEVEADGLRCNGQPWREGGLACAEAALKTAR